MSSILTEFNGAVGVAAVPVHGDVGRDVPVDVVAEVVEKPVHLGPAHRVGQPELQVNLGLNKVVSGGRDGCKKERLVICSTILNSFFPCVPVVAGADRFFRLAGGAHVPHTPWVLSLIHI